MPTLVIDLKIPIEAEPLIGAAAFTFTHWLPCGKDQGIRITSDKFELLIWFDLKSTWWASQPSEEDLKKHTNVLARYVCAEATATSVDLELAKYMEGRDFSEPLNPSNANIQKRYEALGSEVLELILTSVNRLITFARIVKGQYWLKEYPVSANDTQQYFQNFEAVGCIDEGERFRFQPATRHVILVTLTPEEKYIRQDEWEDVVKFVQGKNRPSLVLELLSGAQKLAGNGYNRNAIAEAVTALEVAISEFARSPNCEAKLASKFSARMGTDSLSNQVNHMGLTGTVRYLLPLLLSEDELPHEILKGCSDAITARQNVVHRGQRDVKNINTLISSIESCCNVLSRYAASP